MKWSSLLVFFGLVVGTSSVPAESSHYQLSFADVRNLMEEMFSYHVETRELTPTLVKRSFKIFAEQFDPYKIYLTQEELRPLLELGPAQIEEVIDHYFSDLYPAYNNLNQTIVQAVARARSWRQEFYRDFIQQGEALAAGVNGSKSATGSTASTEQLRGKLRSELLRLFALENKTGSPDFWTLERREKVCRLFERRFVHYEDKYSSHENQLSQHILRSMARGLDAHTAFFSPQEASEMRASLERQFEGIGVVLREGLDGIEISDFVKGGPAEQSGKIYRGDLVVSIDGESVLDQGYSEVLDRLKGKGGRLITLGLKRGESVYEVELRRQKIVMGEDRLQYNAEPFADGIIGKITLPSFYESADQSSCESDLRQALRELKKQGNLRGLVLDMRNNLGGFLSQAVKVSSLFLTSGVVVVSKYAQGEIQYLRNLDPRVYYQGPLVILTSKLSASAAEIVAQALQDYGVGLVAGDERTYGKGTIQYQTITDTGAQSFFKVTVGRYYTVSGRSTQIEGVKADIVVPSMYASYAIGEKYLEYALRGDQVSAVYVDSLHDIPHSSKEWFRKNYLPHLQKKELRWAGMVPGLQKNSARRISQDPDYIAFLDQPGDSSYDRDLPMHEAVNIVKDMIQFSISR